MKKETLSHILADILIHPPSWAPAGQYSHVTYLGIIYEREFWHALRNGMTWCTTYGTEDCDVGHSHALGFRDMSNAVGQAPRYPAGCSSANINEAYAEAERRVELLGLTP